MEVVTHAMPRHWNDIILVVDDHTDSRLALTRLLRYEGYPAIAASSGGEALRAARRCRPSLVIMDHLMPDMTGLDVLRRLKADPATAGIPVLFYTATSPAESRAQALELGARDWCLKASVAWSELRGISQDIRGRRRAVDHAGIDTPVLEETPC